MNHRKTCCGRDFTLVVAGQIISLFGNAILRFALPLYLLKETGSSALFGTVTALALLPMILLSLLGGVLADRVNKRNIMAGLDFLTAFIILVFYVLVGRAPVIPLFIVTLMLLYGVSGTYQPAVQASIPALVPKERVLPAKRHRKPDWFSGELYRACNWRYAVWILGDWEYPEGQYPVLYHVRCYGAFYCDSFP